jgi:putative lipase involved disintegration of autophagic bodies
LVLTTITYFVFKLGLIAKITILAPWTLPGPIGALSNISAFQSPLVANNAPIGPGNVHGAKIVIFAINPNYSSFTIHIYSFGFNDDHVFCF